MKNYVEYTYRCSDNSYVQTKVFQFPKISENNLSKIIGFGDWSNSSNGKQTLNLLQKYIKDSDLLTWLGDMAYDLYVNSGKVGNDFLNFAQPIFSEIPIQVYLFI